MPKVLTTAEYQELESKHADSIKFSLTKVEHYDLKPYGRFTIKFRTSQGHLPNIIPFNELKFNYDECMPVDDKTDKQIVKFMKTNKTDILVDSRGDFYTRAGSGFVRVGHPKLSKYSYDEAFKEIVDCI